MLHRIPSWWVVGLAVGGCAQTPAGPTVRPGIEVLATDSVHLIAGRRVGLLTNHTGLARDGTHDVELLLASGIRLTALFSPEHGFRGVLDQPDVDHGVDSATGLPIFSLYGDTRAPTAAMLRDIDVLVIDLQDIGARPYTYISTALMAMRSAGQHGIAVVVADRPNPIGGRLVQGPILDTAFASFVGMLPLPQRHGLTMGELARFGRFALGIDVELHVAPVAGWLRSMWFDDTALPWVRPSPNMPDVESATHYPGTVWFEATNLSVGRGTPIAFQMVGAPWLRPADVIARLPRIPGVNVSDTVVTPFEPPDGKHGGEAIPAVRLLVSDRETYDSSRLAAALMQALAAVHPDEFVIDRPAALVRLSGTRDILAVAHGTGSAADLAAGWSGPVDTFRDVRRRHLIYPGNGGGAGRP